MWGTAMFLFFSIATLFQDPGRTFRSTIGATAFFIAVLLPYNSGWDGGNDGEQGPLITTTANECGELTRRGLRSDVSTALFASLIHFTTTGVVSGRELRTSVNVCVVL
jgi:hypothetical protein